MIQNPETQTAIIDLATGITGYENAWRASVNANPRDQQTYEDASQAMSLNARLTDDAQARVAAAIGADFAVTLRAALVGATASVQAANPRTANDSDPTLIAKIIRRPHDYF